MTGGWDEGAAARVQAALDGVSEALSRAGGGGSCPAPSVAGPDAVGILAEMSSTWSEELTGQSRAVGEVGTVTRGFVDELVAGDASSADGMRRR